MFTCYATARGHPHQEWLRLLSRCFVLINSEISECSRRFLFSSYCNVITNPSYDRVAAITAMHTTTRLRFEVFSLEKLWSLDKVFVLPPLEIGLSVAVGGGGE